MCNRGSKTKLMNKVLLKRESNGKTGLVTLKAQILHLPISLKFCLSNKAQNNKI